MRSLVNAVGGEERNVTRHRVEARRGRATARGRSRSRSPRDRMMGEACRSRRLAARPAFALRRDIVRHDAVDARFAGLLGDQRQAELGAHHSGQEAADRVGLPSQDAFMMVAMVAPGLRWSIASTRACFESAQLGLFDDNFLNDIVEILCSVGVASCAVTTEAPHWRESRRGRIPKEPLALYQGEPVTLCSQRKSSLFWITLWLASRRTVIYMTVRLSRWFTSE